MRRCYFSAALAWLVCAACAIGQFGSFGDVPVSITADGNTRFEGGVAIAEDNVQIHYGDYSIYCDYAEYNPDTRDVLAYRQHSTLHAERNADRSALTVQS